MQDVLFLDSLVPRYSIALPLKFTDVLNDKEYQMNNDFDTVFAKYGTVKNTFYFRYLQAIILGLFDFSATHLAILSRQDMLHLTLLQFFGDREAYFMNNRSFYRVQILNMKNCSFLRFWGTILFSQLLNNIKVINLTTKLCIHQI